MFTFSSMLSYLLVLRRLLCGPFANPMMVQLLGGHSLPRSVTVGGERVALSFLSFYGCQGPFMRVDPMILCRIVLIAHSCPTAAALDSICCAAQLPKHQQRPLHSLFMFWRSYTFVSSGIVLGSPRMFHVERLPVFAVFSKR